MNALRGYIWMLRRFGFGKTAKYELRRRHLEKRYGPFDPNRDGEPLLRALGATEDQIRVAKERGLA